MSVSFLTDSQIACVRKDTCSVEVNDFQSCRCGTFAWYSAWSLNSAWPCTASLASCKQSPQWGPGVSCVGLTFWLSDTFHINHTFHIKTYIPHKDIHSTYSYGLWRLQGPGAITRGMFGLWCVVCLLLCCHGINS